MSADLLFRNVHLATMTGDGIGELRDGALAVEGGRIAWFGPAADTPAALKPSIEVDGQGGWLLPGLIDCHTHLVWAGNRTAEFERLRQGETYAEIAASGGGIRATVRATRADDEDDLFEAARARLSDFAADGVTTIEIKSGYGLDLETELRCLRVAHRLGATGHMRVSVTYLGAHAVPSEFEGRADAYVDMIVGTVLPQVAALGYVDAVDAFCERIAFSPQQAGRVLEAAKSHGFAVKLHADQLTDSGGGGLAASLGGLSADHLECASEASVRAMAAASTVAVLLPGAFITLGGERKPPVELFRRFRVPMALSTDCNPGSSPTTSLRMMLHLACTTFGLTPTEALLGVTRHAAQALGRQATAGEIVLGRPADLALFELDHPRDLAATFIGRPLRARWIGGVPVRSG